MTLFSRFFYTTSKHAQIHLIEKSDIKNAIDLLEKQSLPSHKTVDLLVQNILDSEDIQLLARLRAVIPFQTPLADKLYAKEHSLRMKRIMIQWKDNLKLEAVYDALKRYETVWEEEWCVDPELFESTLKSVRLLLRTFSQMLLADDGLDVSHVSSLQEIKSFGIQFSNF